MLYIILMHISHFMFFANDLLLAVYFIFTEIMLDKKQIQVILFQCKMGNKAADTPHNINNASKKKKNASGPGTANERAVQWWFKKFCKGDERLEDEECSSQPSEADKDQ